MKMWSTDKVNDSVKKKWTKTGNGKNLKKEKDRSKGSVVIPYVKIFSRVIKKHGRTVSMRPHNALRKALVHPKDKVEKENTCCVVYEIPCHNCEVKYVGETGRKFITRLKEHQTDIRNVPQVYTRSERKSFETCFHNSAVTDHIVKATHVIN